MSKKYKYLTVGILGGLLVGSLFLSAFTYIFQDKIKEDKIPLSVLAYGDNAERWIAFRQGINQAAQDLNVTVNFLVLPDDEQSETQQETVILRELEQNTKGILLVPESSTRDGGIEAALRGVPVVLAENTLENYEHLPCVSGDDKAMGRGLGALIEEQESGNEKIYLVQANTSRINVSDRGTGLRNQLEEAGYEVETWDLEGDRGERLLEKMSEIDSGTIVAMDDETLELTAEVKAQLKSGLHVFGIGSSNQNVYYLDRGMIQGLVFQNEFNMGYVALEQLAEKVRYQKEASGETIEFQSVTQGTLHLPENERLLYPIVQ